MRKRYAASLSAFTNKEHAHCAYVFYAKDDIDAVRIAREKNEEQLPPSEGWKMHTESIIELVGCE